MKEFVLIGTTASGKSSLSLELANALDGIILSLDSLCVYKQINIANAKPSQNDLAKILHFGINIKNINDNFSAGEFFCEYKKAKEFAQKNNKILIITGGSGFYLKALLNGLAPKVPKAKIYPDNNKIYAIAEKIDENFSKKYSKNDTFRLQKWYDIYSYAKIPPSVFLAQNTKEPLIKNIKIFNLCWQKDELKKRVITRTQEMFANGLLDEAKELFDKYDENLKPLCSIGLKECKEFFDNKIKSQNDLAQLIITHTMQLAKRQSTFFSSQFQAQNLDCKNLQMCDKILPIIKEYI